MSRIRMQILGAAAIATAAMLVPTTPAQAAPATFQTAVLASNPYVYYRQGESSGTTAADTGPNNLPGTYQGSPTLGAAGVGSPSDTAVSYSGADGTYMSSNINGFGHMAGTASYEFLFKVNPGFDNTVIQSLFGVYTAGGSLPDINIDMNSKGNDNLQNPDLGNIKAFPNFTRLFVRGNNADTNGGASIAGDFENATLYDGNYHDLIFTYDNAQTGADAFKAYVDGVPQTISFTQVNGSVEPDTFSDFDVPAAFLARNIRTADLSNVTREANVTLDEAALYGTVLSADDAAAHATAAGFVVPEPTSLALLGIGGLGLLRRRRRSA